MRKLSHEIGAFVSGAYPRAGILVDDEVALDRRRGAMFGQFCYPIDAGDPSAGLLEHNDWMGDDGLTARSRVL